MSTQFYSLPLLLCCVSIACAAPVDPESGNAKPSCPELANAGYRLAFSDEFNGSKLDEGKWDYRTDSKALSTQLPANTKIDSGHLVLGLKQEQAKGKQYTGGGIISKSTFKFGYYEARLKVPPGAGWHTSFWMMKHDGNGGTNPKATCQELDVIENDSINKTSYGVNVHKWKAGHISFGGKAVKTPDLSQDFHIFGCEFTPTTVKYYFDGALVQTVDITKAAKKNGQTVDFELGDQNIWLTSIAYGGKGVDDSKLPATAEFDYVRLFEKE